MNLTLLVTFLIGINKDQEIPLIPVNVIFIQLAYSVVRFLRIHPGHYRNPTIYNMICWFAGSLGQMTRQPSVPCIIFFFHEKLQKSLQKPFQFIFLSIYKIIKMKIKSFECPKSMRNYKKKILGRSDTWSTSRLSQRPNQPVYYIVDCWILEHLLCIGERFGSSRLPVFYNFLEICILEIFQLKL